MGIAPYEGIYKQSVKLQFESHTKKTPTLFGWALIVSGDYTQEVISLNSSM